MSFWLTCLPASRLPEAAALAAAAAAAVQGMRQSTVLLPCVIELFVLQRDAGSARPDKGLTPSRVQFKNENTYTANVKYMFDDLIDSDV